GRNTFRPVLSGGNRPAGAGRPSERRWGSGTATDGVFFANCSCSALPGKNWPGLSTESKGRMKDETVPHCGAHPPAVGRSQPFPEEEPGTALSGGSAGVGENH